MDAIWQDVVYGVRQLLRRPGLTALALITLALGIGANAAIFSVVDAVLLRPLPYAHSDRLVRLTEDAKDIPGMSISMEDFNDWRTMNTVFNSMAPYQFNSMVLTGMGDAEQLDVNFITAGLFPTLGIQPTLGRALTPEDDKVGAAPVVMISDSFWTRKFAKDPGAIGKSLTLDGSIYTIVGVLPSSHFHGAWRTLSVFPSLWHVEDKLGGPQRRDNHPGIYAYGLLKPGVTLQQAQAQMSQIAARLVKDYPSTNGVKATDVTVDTLLNVLVGDVRPGLLVTMATAGFVLLIACANVANLVLARATERYKEMAIRTALGAKRFRLVRQLLTESMLLGVAGGVLGLMAAFASVGVLSSVARTTLPRLENLSIDFRVLCFTLGISVLTALFFGIMPALQASRADVHDALKEGGRGTSAGAGQKRLRSILVASEIAISLVLLIGAGLMIKSLYRVLHADSGFDSTGAVDTSFVLPATRYKDISKMRQYVDPLVAKLSAIPGVQAAGYKDTLLGGAQDGYLIEGKAAPLPGQEPLTDDAHVTPKTLQAMGIRLIRGRYFNEFDNEKAPLVCIVDTTMAESSWPGEDAIGKRLMLVMGAGQPRNWMTVVGVVAHTKNYGVDQPSRVETYFPFDQYPLAFGDFVVRSTSNFASVDAAIREAAHSIDSDVALTPVRTVDDIVGETVAPRRLSVTLLSIFATLALALAAIGIYGVMSYTVTQRNREIGIRIALGAQRKDVMGIVIGNGMKLLAAGVAIGLVSAFFLTRLVASLLFEVKAVDAMTFITLPAILALVALAACYIPARRAMQVDPIIALRDE